jgi:hypothetical protein
MLPLTLLSERKFSGIFHHERKILQLKICHPFPKQKTLIFTHKKEGPVWASLWIDLSVCGLDAWERGRFFVSWCLRMGGSALPSHPTHVEY